MTQVRQSVGYVQTGLFVVAMLFTVVALWMWAEYLLVHSDAMSMASAFAWTTLAILGQIISAVVKYLNGGD